MPRTLVPATLAIFLSAFASCAVAQEPLAVRPARMVVVLPDETRWVPAPALLPIGAQAAMLAGKTSRAEPLTIQLKFPAGYRIPPHSQWSAVHITVLSGILHVGAGEKFEPNGATRLPPGSFVVLPPRVPHFVWASEETVILLHSVGLWGLSYVDNEDDPLKAWQ